MRRQLNTLYITTEGAWLRKDGANIVMEVEGEDTEDMQLSRAVELMKGPAGETVNLKVRHMGDSEDVSLELERAIIQVSSVLGQMLLGCSVVLPGLSQLLLGRAVVRLRSAPRIANIDQLFGC